MAHRMNSSAQVKPFGFDRIFAAPDSARPFRRGTDARDLARELERSRAEQKAGEEAHRAELARTRSEAFEAGLAHAREERDAAALSALDALHASLENMEQQQDRMQASLSREAADLALSVAESLAGHAISREPGRAIDEAIGRALAQLARGQELHVTVHPTLVEEIERRIAIRQSGDRRRLFLSVAADPAIAPGDAMLTWDSGGLSLDAEARRAAVLAELAPLREGDESAGNARD